MDLQFRELRKSNRIVWFITIICVLAAILHLTSRLRGEFVAMFLSGGIVILTKLPVFYYLFGIMLLFAVGMFFLNVIRRQFYEAALWLAVPLAYDTIQRVAFKQYLPASVFVVLPLVLVISLIATRRVKYTPTTMFLLGMAIVVLLTAFYSQSSISNNIIQDLSYALLMLAAVNILKNVDQLSRLMLVYAVAIMIASLPDVVILLMKFQALYMSGRLSFLLEGGVNSFATMTALAALAALILSKTGHHRIWMLGLYAALVGFTLLSGSRVQVGVLGVASLVIAIQQRRYWLAAGILGVVIFLYIGSIRIYALNRLFFGEDALTSRLDNYAVGLNVGQKSLESILFGIGPSEWRDFSTNYYGKFTWLHNPIISTYVQSGIIAALLLALFMVWTMVNAAIKIFHGGFAAQIAVLQLAVIAVTASYSLYNYLPFWVLGLCEGYYMILRAGKKVPIHKGVVRLPMQGMFKKKPSLTLHNHEMI